MNETLNIINETFKKLETLHNSRSDLSKQLNAVEEKLKTAESLGEDAAKVLELEQLKYVILVSISENNDAFFSTYSSALQKGQAELEVIKRNADLLEKYAAELKQIYQSYPQTLEPKPSGPRNDKLH